MSEKIRAEDEQQPENKEIGESENIGAVSLRKQKEVVWREKEKEIDTWADNLGAPIDAGIKKAVIAFNLAGFPTTASCEGHLDTGLPAPWMRVAVLDEPEQRFVGENEIFQRYADRLNVSLEEMRRMTNVPESEYWQAAKECSKNEETEEYRRWFEETQKIRKILIGLVKEFYQNRKASSDIRLVVNSCGQGGFEIHNGGRDYRPVPENMKPDMKMRLEKMLRRYQKEMVDFSNFVKEKYLCGELPTRKK